MVIKYKEKKSKVVLTMKNGKKKIRYLTIDQFVKLVGNWPKECKIISF